MPKESSQGSNKGNGATPTLADATPDIPPITDPATELKLEFKLPDSGIKPWSTFLRSAKTPDIQNRFAAELADILTKHHMEKYCALALFEPDDSIDSYDLDRIFGALSEQNSDRSKDVLLLLLSRGGSIESAYQISKLCKSFAREHFIALIPRHAKSAATLIAIGADEIHMGPLGQLGPIDPQLGGLPALGVSQALKTIASVAEAFPGSAEMFARYLKMVLTVEQIGYCDRISESAAQYAVRLLSTKHGLGKSEEAIAKELVHEYKDHGFVIDFEEAKMHLGGDWVKTGTPELAAAEEIYTHFENVNFFMGFVQQKRLIVTGGMTLPSSIIVFKRSE